VTEEEKVSTWTQTGEEKVNTWTQTGEEKVSTWTQRGATTIFTINCENQDSNSRPWALIPCQASCTSQCNQKSKLIERASTIHLYTSTPPLTCDGRRESQHVDTKGGNSNFYNKLRKLGLELETLGSDTMLSFMH
jgi:hypothetical protein